jgi:hypothetical protein
METIKLSLLTAGLLLSQAILWLVLAPFRGAVSLFSSIAYKAVTASMWFRGKVALLVFPVAKLQARISEAAEIGVKGLIEKAYGE